MQMAYNTKLFDLFLDVFQREGTYLFTRRGRHSYADVLEVANSISPFLDADGSCCLDIRNVNMLIGAIWGCIRHNKSFILLPTSISSDLRSDIIIESKCSQLVYDDNSSEGNLRFLRVGEAKKHEFDTIGRVGFLSSGTTGVQKLIWVTYEQITSSLLCLQRLKIMPYVRNQHVCLTQPISHSYGFSCLLEYSLGGSVLILPDNNDILGIFNVMSIADLRSSITAIEGVPYFYENWITISYKLKFENLKHLGFGGDFVKPSLLDLIKKEYNSLGVSIRYGVTELPSVISLIHFDLNNFQYPSYGIVLPIYKIRINRFELADEGEIVVQEFSSSNSAVFSEIFTGDIGTIMDGKLSISGRCGSFNKYKGYKISFTHIEEVAMSSGMLRETRCRLSQEHLIMDIVPLTESFSRDEFESYLSKKLPFYSLPHKLLVVDRLERTYTGKLKR